MVLADKGPRLREVKCDFFLTQSFNVASHFLKSSLQRLSASKCGKKLYILRYTFSFTYTMLRTQRNIGFYN